MTGAAARYRYTVAREHPRTLPISAAVMSWAFSSWAGRYRVGECSGPAGVSAACGGGFACGGGAFGLQVDFELSERREHPDHQPPRRRAGSSSPWVRGRITIPSSASALTVAITSSGVRPRRSRLSTTSLRLSPVNTPHPSPSQGSETDCCGAWIGCRDAPIASRQRFRRGCGAQRAVHSCLSRSKDVSEAYTSLLNYLNVDIKDTSKSTLGVIAGGRE